MGDTLYSVDSAWPREPVCGNTDKLLRGPAELGRGRVVLYHGDWNDWGSIRSSFDLSCEEHSVARERRVKIETQLLEKFAVDADLHLARGARRTIERARLRWKTLRTTGTLFVGRHHGLPTRCVDWTRNLFTGLFFACGES